MSFGMNVYFGSAQRGVTRIYLMRKTINFKLEFIKVFVCTT